MAFSAACINPFYFASFQPIGGSTFTGFDIEESVPTPIRFSRNPLNSSFHICPICLGTARDPIVASCCGHWYCCYCFMKWFAFGTVSMCANCRTPNFFTSNRLPINRSIAYNSLRVKCGYDCGKAGTIQAIEKHEVFQCERRKIRCPFPDCSVIAIEADVKLHMLHCPKQMQFCTTCNLPTQIQDFSSHNCIEKLKTQVQIYQTRLEFLHFPVLPEERLGLAGQFVLRAPPDPIKGSPMENYCKRFSKTFPYKRHLQSQPDPELGSKRFNKFEFFYNKRVKLPSPRAQNPVQIDLTSSSIPPQNF